MRTKITETAFDGQKIFVGLDVHKKDFKVSVMVGGMFYKTFTSPADGRKVVNYLHDNFPGAEYYSAYEAGFSGYGLHKQLTMGKVKNIVVNPADIPTTDKERKQKEDKRDSLKIARDLQANQLRGIFIPKEKTLHDRALVRGREAIVKDIRRAKQRIKSLLYFFGVPYPEKFASENTHWSKNFIKWLGSVEFENESARQALGNYITTFSQQRQLLLQATKQIRGLSKSDIYKERVELMVSAPGIGMLTAMKLLTELETFDRFKNFESLCSYVGLVPSTSSSSDTERVRGITPRHCAPLRSALIESAWVAIRNDPALTARYVGCRKRMDENKAIVRIAKALLNRVVHILRKKEKYEKGVVK
jgi:transposase